MKSSKPKLDQDSVREWGRRYSTWGRFGPEDERGALNFITPGCILAATALPRRGQVISCALPFDQSGPQTGAGGRFNPIHVMLSHGGDALCGAQDHFPGGFRYADDAVTMPLQCGTQWDSLAHVFYDGKMYNDRDIRLVTGQGAAKNGIETTRHGIVGRGVLLDFPKHFGVDWLEDGRAIGPEDLDACAEAEGVAIGTGDILLIRTGMMKRCLEQKSWAGYCEGSAPGLSVYCAPWLHEREIAAICSDTAAVEVMPSEAAGCVAPLHMISLRNGGIFFGEMFALDELAKACAEDGRYAFLFTAPALPITGAVGSPINPLAIR